MSEVLLEYAEPLFVAYTASENRAVPEETWEHMIAFAIAAWNASVLPIDKREELIETFMQKTNQDIQLNLR